jgi:hypothetical protein
MYYFFYTKAQRIPPKGDFNFKFILYLPETLKTSTTGNKVFIFCNPYFLSDFIVGFFYSEFPF